MNTMRPCLIRTRLVTLVIGSMVIQKWSNRYGLGKLREEPG